MNNAPLTARDIHGPYMQLLTNLQGDHGQEWLEALKKFNRKENPWGTKVYDNHLTVFNPTIFIGKGWSFTEVRNLRSAELGLLIDYSKVKLSTDWLEGESCVDGKTRRTRILADTVYTPLHTDHFLDLWNNKEKIPKEWKKVRHVITFDGDVLRNSNNNRFVLCLYWSEGEWNWCYYLLGSWWSNDSASAVIAG